MNEWRSPTGGAPLSEEADIRAEDTSPAPPVQLPRFVGEALLTQCVGGGGNNLSEKLSTQSGQVQTGEKWVVTEGEVVFGGLGS